MARQQGYTYVVGKDGKKHRVYATSKSGRSRTLKGNGGYYDSSFVKTMKKTVPRGSFKAAGEFIGGPLGKAVGGQIAKIVGFGEYRVNKNSLIDEGNSPAAMHSTRSNATIRHREYIADIVSGASPNAFDNTVYPINPGLPGSMPWLAPIASQYEQYMIKGMVFEFKSQSSDTTVTSNSYIGGVVLATDYNPLNGGFTNKQQMENTQYTTSCKISECCYHAIECAPNSMPTKQLYVRSGAVPANADQRLYDLGTFNIATFGVQSANQVLGELWCSYEIELIKPVSVAAAGSLVPSDHIQLSVASMSGSVPFGAGPGTLVDGSSIGGSVSINQYSFPLTVQEGNFLFVISWSGSSAAIARPNVTLTNAILLQYMGADTSTLMFAPQNGVSSQELMLSFLVQVQQPGAIVTLGTAGTLPASPVSADLWVTQIDNDIGA